MFKNDAMENKAIVLEESKGSKRAAPEEKKKPKACETKKGD
jgi:hypothetical protein